MRSILPAALAIILSAGCAQANAYADFSRGIDANNRGNSNAAVAAFTRALDAGDLPLPYVPSAYVGRARAYLDTVQCAAAVTDLDSALRLRPDYADAYQLRARADDCLGRQDAALTDITAAISLRPVAGHLFERARLLWNSNRYAEAAGDANAAAAREPGNPYYLLWTAVIGERAGHFNGETFLGLAKNFTGNAWPQPLLGLFANRTRPDEVYRAAALGLGRNPANQKCEADFYVGEWRLLRGETDAARLLIRTAANECPRNYLAWSGATAELRRLDQPRTASVW
jgi:lipoprotein NlpI